MAQDAVAEQVTAPTRAPSPVSRLRGLKAWLIATSVGAFATLLGLAGLHVTGVTARTHAGSQSGPDFGAAENAFFGGSGQGGQSGFGFGGGSSSTSGVPAATTTVS